LDADLQAAVEDRRDVLVTLLAEVGINYIDLRRLEEQRAIAEENLQIQQKTADITRRRFEAGFANGLDVANAQAQTATTASQIPVLESAIQSTIYNISVLLGEEPTALAEELQETAPIPVTPPRIPVGLPSDLIRRRPDIRRMEAQVHAATARIGAATADLYPKFSLTGFLDFSAEDMGSLARWRNRSWSVGPNVQWPIFNAGRIRWNIEVQKAVEEETLLVYQQTVLTALKDVETALTSYTLEQEHLRLLGEAVVNNRKAVDLAMELYTSGETDFLNVLTAQRSLFISEEAHVQSIGNLAVDGVSLYKALGGGWEKGEDGMAR
jgi:NodT family efflux transporter outer membrane factor (OMF) lipoprotein